MDFLEKQQMEFKMQREEDRDFRHGQIMQTRIHLFIALAAALIAGIGVYMSARINRETTQMQIDAQKEIARMQLAAVKGSAPAAITKQATSQTTKTAH